MNMTWIWNNTALCRCPCRNLCVPYDPPYQDEHGTVQCRYKTLAFSIGIKHTVFFLKNATVCSSVAPEPLDLSLHCEFDATPGNHRCRLRCDTVNEPWCCVCVAQWERVNQRTCPHTIQATEAGGSVGPAPTPPPPPWTKISPTSSATDQTTKTTGP